MSHSDLEQDDSNLGSGDANDIQRAIRARALHTIRRRPVKFWYSSPQRLVVAIAMAAVLMVSIGLGIDQCLRAFHLLVSLYTSSSQSASPPDNQEPQVFFIQPDPSVAPPAPPEPSSPAK